MTRCAHQLLQAALLAASLGILAATGFSSLHAQDVNIALGKEVSASGEVWSGQVPENLTDGDYNNQTHPLASSGTLGFYYDIDLEQEYHLDRIVISNRTGCCPERLTNYRVAVHADNQGSLGARLWAHDVRTDGSSSGDGGKDVLRASLNPTGTFSGRYIRITNLSNAAYNPQMAELEVYVAPVPVIEFFGVDHGNITQSGDPALPTSAMLSWRVRLFESITIDRGIGAVTGPAGSLTVSPLSTTVYTLTASNASGTATAKITVAVDAVTVNPVLSEFMAANSSTVEDEDGDDSDWIELHNPNPFSVSLEGYRLTNDPTGLTSWRLPAVGVVASGHLLVFASGKNRSNPAGQLHSSFRLEKNGGYLALLAPDGRTVLQQFPADYPATLTYPVQRRDLSYGRGSDGGEGYQGSPTPGAPNGPTFDGFVEDTTFAPDRGFYDAAIDVVIATATPGAQIRYSIDGSEPTATQGNIYTGPVRVSTTRTLRAAAFKTGLVSTNVDTHSYLFLDSIIAAAVMNKAITQAPAYAPQMRGALTDLPTISVVTRGTINGTSEIKASIEWIAPDGSPGFQEDAGVKNYGGAFTNFAKKNFRLYFRRVYGAAKLQFPLFAGHDRGVRAVERFDQLELRGGSHDMVERGFYMSNRFTDDTMLDMGNLNPHGRFVHLYLNGTYWGQYHLRERWNADMLAQYLGGDKEDYESINGNWNVGGWAEPGSAYDGDGSAWTRIKSLRSNYAAVKSYLDVPHYVDYMLLFMFGDAEQEYRCVGPSGVGGGFKFFLNDADGFLRTAGNRTVMGRPGRVDGDGPGSIFSMLLASGHVDYLALLGDRIHRHYANDGALTPSKNRARLLNRTTEVERAFLAESARWGYRTPASWESARNSYLSNVLPQRTATVLGQFRAAGFLSTLAAPRLNQHGGAVPDGFAVTLEATAGTTYYSMDTSDPRLPGGAISPTAQTFAAAGTRTVLVGESSRVAALVPLDAALGDNWKRTGFVETDWLVSDAGAGVGYDDQPTYLPHIDLNVGAQMKNVNSTVYVRHRFLISNPATFRGLELKLKYDDGYAAFLNGQLIASRNAPDPVEWNAAATVSHDDAASVVFEVAAFTRPAPHELLRAGENVLAIHGLNFGVGSTDMLIEAELVGLTGGEGQEIRLDRTTLWKARAHLDGRWSPVTEAIFVLDSSALRITELMYHPAPSENVLYSDEDMEFIEFQNVGSKPLNLTGMTLGEAVSFTFPDGDASSDNDLQPGEVVLVVKNLAAFAAIHETNNLLIAGEFDGQLNNAGERLVLRDRLGRVLVDFSYADTWYPSTDGEGSSLEIVDPRLDVASWGTASSWRASRLRGGSPGEVPIIPAGSRQRPGDTNHDGKLDIADVIALLFELFVAPTALPCGDSTLAHPSNVLLVNFNGDTRVDVSDVVALLNFLFRAGAGPALGLECVEIEGCPNLCMP